mgnify:FL=1
MSELTAEVAKAKEASAVLEAQYKNAQEDVNFAQMCVKNLQATLAVYKKEEKVEEKEEIVEEKEEEEKEVVVKVCEACAKKEEQIEAQQARLCVMDAELVKTRRVAREKVTMRTDGDA